MRHIDTLLNKPKELFKCIQIGKLGRINGLSLLFNLWDKNRGRRTKDTSRVFECVRGIQVIGDEERLAQKCLHYNNVFSENSGSIE